MEPLHDVRFPGETRRVPGRAQRVAGRGARAAPPHHGARAAALASCRSGARSRPTTRSRRGRRVRAPLRPLRGRQGHALPVQLHVGAGVPGLPFVGPCPSCTAIIDAMDGQVPHLEQRISFAVACKAPLEEFRAHGRSRGWQHTRLLSAIPSAYNADYKAEDADGNQWPLATVFVRRDGRIHHFWSSELFFVDPDGGPGPASRRLHVAAVRGARPDARRPRRLRAVALYG